MPLANPVTAVRTSRSAVLPSPTWPVSLWPQHCASPRRVTAHVCISPAESIATPFASPVTSTGVSRVVVELSPRPPWPLHPQHRAPPLRVTLDPARGVGRRVVLPCKSTRFSCPRHFPPPPVVGAQVWFPPVAMATTPLARPETPEAVSRRSSVPPSPTWPP